MKKNPNKQNLLVALELNHPEVKSLVWSSARTGGLCRTVTWRRRLHAAAPGLLALNTTTALKPVPPQPRQICTRPM